MKYDVTFERIEDAYRHLAYNLKWGFLTCQRDKFLNPRVLLVGLNPGGGRGDGEKSNWERERRFSQEEGNSYLVENWGENDDDRGQAPLQLQVQGLCRFIDADIADLASANFV